jgi:hypothetical protein
MLHVVETDMEKMFAVFYGISFVAFCGGSVSLALDQI